MATTVEKKFYEFTIRAKGGMVTGAHVGYVRIVEDGGIITETPLPVMSVSMAAGEPGIPLSEITGEINLALQKTNDALAGDVAATSAANDALIERNSYLEEYNTALITENQSLIENANALQAEITRLTGIIEAGAAVIENENPS